MDKITSDYKIYLEELDKITNFIQENIEFFNTAIIYFSITITNIISDQSQLEDNIDKIIQLYYSLQNQKILDKDKNNTIQKIVKNKYVNNHKRNNILKEVANSLDIKKFDITPFEQAANIRNDFGHIRIKIKEINNIPYVYLQSKEGDLDIEELSIRYKQENQKAQKMLEPLFMKYNISPLYWRGIYEH